MSPDPILVGGVWGRDNTDLPLLGLGIFAFRTFCKCLIFGNIAMLHMQKSQRETTIGTILRVKLKDKDYERTKTTLHIKWRIPVLI